MENRPASFHSIYERYARELHSYLYYLSGRRDIAEELTAETFLRIWASPVPVEIPPVKAYLFTIARRLFLTEVNNKASGSGCPKPSPHRRWYPTTG